ncbi:MAG: ATP-binding protein [Myxococcota bacterium]
MRRVLKEHDTVNLDVDELYVVSPSLEPIASIVGQPPQVTDQGLRAALQLGRPYTETVGRRALVVTSPIMVRGKAAGALRVSAPLRALNAPGPLLVAILGYTVFSGGLVALFGFVLFRRRLLQPIATLRQGTARIASGDFGHQVQLDAARELQELSADLNQMSASLAQQLSRLETASQAVARTERLAVVGRLAAGIAHEVGNPLAAVSGYAELLEQGLGDPALEADLVGRMREELSRIDRIIHGLLRYARPGAGEAGAVRIQDALEGAAEILRMRPEGRTVSVDISTRPSTLTAWVSADALRQVLLNVLLNAAQAASQTIRLRAWRMDDGWVVVRCEDDGTGFSDVALEHALEPFFTTKDIGQGTGMGLAISVQLIEAAGGQLFVGNLEAGGGMVRLLLPGEEDLG